MLRPRIIPCLLVHEGGLVKTVQFKDPKYVGDPINAVKIFNEKEADELVVLDIDASANGVEPDFQMIAHLAAECRMPLCYGGGVTTAAQANKIIGLGVEKVAISAAAIDNPTLVSEMAAAIGSQSVVVILDVKKKTGLFKKGYELTSHNAKKSHKVDIFEFAAAMERAGAGEIIINMVDRDGMMDGYDIELAKEFRDILNIPMTILGGAGSHDHIEDVIANCGIIGASAGSLFVFKGPYKAVLINYPEPAKKDVISANAMQRLGANG
ncbi:imidazole glycerol phosphate synthase subunit HisF [Sphingorhabdus lutea]|uniref:Imidazole glycerol phosphate synthase subunit HisF n=1 Tax=Sphingorhabdus lutea TaxID=1913578 RepID=A0A1L3JBI3_9SPHN|nr:AglZ/HisF2 family acetamidino modification protein [Sphingorhabdus lutea]APG62491.1 imidazole glycerol phosphate synthase subunit HisF [Sphingorhabdus lutea]